MEPYLACAASAWYPRYAQHAFTSRVIELPPDFLAYLLEDGVVVAEGSAAMPRRAQPATVITDADGDEYRDWSDEDEAAEEGGGQPDWTQRFPQLHAAIEAAIQELGGRVAPKLDWSAPTDALWVSHNQSLACSNAEQVVLLLKSSDRVAHDVELAQGLGAAGAAAPAASDAAAPSGGSGSAASDAAAPSSGPAGGWWPSLVLRRWHELRPEREFRCFVHQHDLHAISQRDASQHFPQLAGEAGALRSAICAFHRRHVGDSFPLEDYALDLYVATSGTVRIVDFNPIADTTAPLLFSWEELPYEWPRPGGDAAPEAAPAAAEAGPEQQPGAGGAGTRAADGGEGGSGGEREEVGSSDEGDDDLVDIRMVGHAGMVQPGARQACGMPYDMLSLQDPGAMSDIIAMMQRQGAAGEPRE